MSPVKIYRYTPFPPNDPTEAPIDLNYITGLTRKLFPKRFFVQGELQRVEWYADYEPTTLTFSDLVLVVEIDYTRNALGFAQFRTTTRKWIMEDESIAEPIKSTTKHYTADNVESINEGQRRRGNIVANVMSVVSTHLIVTGPSYPADAAARLAIGSAFAAVHDAARNKFVDASATDLYTDIQLATDSWLSENLAIAHNGASIILHDPEITVKDWILAELNLWGL